MELQLYTAIFLLIAVLGLNLIFLYLYRDEKRLYLKLWAFSWGLFLFKTIFEIYGILVYHGKFLFIITQISSLASGIILLWGTSEFLHKKLSKIWSSVGFLVGLWVVWGVFFQLSFLATTLPVYFFSALVYIKTGLVFLKNKEIQGINKFIVGWTFILWGIHKVDYPITRQVEWLAPWGFLLTAVFIYIIGIGTLIIYFEKAKGDLLKSNERFRLMAEFTQDLIYRIRLLPAPKLEYMSPQLKKITGYSPEELLGSGKPALEIVHPEDVHLLEALLAGEIPMDTLNIRLIHKNGAVIWIEMRNTAILDNQGKICAIEGIARDISEKVQENAILKRYQLLFENARDIILLVNFDGRIIEANAAALKAYGYTHEELLEKNIYELRPEHSNKLTRLQMDMAYSAGVIFETVHKRKDGSLLPVEVSSVGAVLMNETILFSIIRDISERKEAELRDRENMRFKEMLAASLNNTPLGLVLSEEINGEMKIVEWNKAGEQILGWSREEVLGKNVNFIPAQEELSEVKEVVKRIAVMEIPLNHKNWCNTKSQGKVLINWFNSPIRDKVTGKLYILSLAEDITGRNIAEEALKRTNILLKAQQESAMDGILVVNETGRVIGYNKRFCNFFSIPEEVLKDAHSSIIIDLILSKLENREVIAEGTRKFMDNIYGEGLDELYLKDGRIFERYTSPVISLEGIYYGRIWFHRDITSRIQEQVALHKRTEELAKTIRELEISNHDLDQFAYVVSHDLKAPLRAIHNLSQWIKEDLTEGLHGETLTHIEILKGRVKRMENFINGILDYSRAGKGLANYEVIDVRSLLEEIIEDISLPVGFIFEIQFDFIRINTVKLRLRQVFANLIDNAVKYHDKTKGRIQIAAQEQKGFYEFLVTDDGPGIKPEYHGKVFEIFQTLQVRDSFESTGIGLALVKKIVESQGGEVTLVSVGRGTTFRFTWPKEPKT